MVLTFFVAESDSVELNIWGVQIREQFIWVSLLIAHAYFCVMAYTQQVFSGIGVESVWK